MRGAAVRPIVIAAGGTGGHLFPAEALTAALVARGHRVALMTDARSGAASREAFAGREVFVLPGAGIAGRGLRRGAAAAVSLARGTLRAWAILARIDACAVVGFGGYPSVAPALGARLLRRAPPVLLHEQNAVLGRANRFLASRAAGLALSFAATARVPEGVAATITGNPVRPAIRARAGAAYDTDDADGRLRLLVLGGSLGARVFADLLPEAIAKLPEALRRRIVLAQQCRNEDLARLRAAYAAADFAWEAAPFFADVAPRLAAAQFVIARAGASTVAELAAIGRPAILVPLPGAIDDHQSANTRPLAAAGAAEAIAQGGLTPALLAERLADWLGDAPRRARAAAAAAALGHAAAAERLADLVERSIAPATEGARAGGRCRYRSARSISSASAASACPASPRCCTRWATRCRAAI
ncbi:MAG: UDP-N-acetylglucosamine--N-acetylmuramyl-(pentapeptide) pyrophosphoryl-undecaprenol N-acetylglucosamine transferase [Rhodospirillales bacterium]|nr:UDP-N-acetylglucosamine--N-acetylmuramyl-(pentapeptide) pyrophosphoryl-undecaprenol N-acetylglucosamine transferase [Rhodospirillales bacterium]